MAGEIPPVGHGRRIEAGALEIAYLDVGPQDGWPVVLSHGFPYDVGAYAEVAPALASAGARAIVPFLRGFGPTRFLRSDTMRSGQQAALSADLVALLDALGIERAVLGGYDWGGLASCVTAALHPERVAGLVTLGGYDVIDRSQALHPQPPTLERTMWYQHLFQTERGRATLRADRRGLCELLWHEWSPTWSFDEATFLRSAPSFDNPDFVDVVVHAYRHAFGLAEGDPHFDADERRLAAKPKIHAPAVTLDGRHDPLKPGGTSHHAAMFANLHEHRTIDAGHDLPQESPAAFVDAVLLVRRWSS